LVVGALVWGAAAAPAQQQPVYAQASGSPFSTLGPAGGGSYPISVAFGPGGTLLATANRDSSDVSVFEVAEDGTLTRVDGSPFSTNGPVVAGTQPYSVAFSPSGGLLATANYGSNNVSVFHVQADGALLPVLGSPFSTGANSQPYSVAFSPDGALLATANSRSSRISVFAVQPGGSLLDVPGSPFNTYGPNGLGSSPLSIAFSPDGRLVATASLISDTVSVFRVAPDGTLNPPGSQFTTNGPSGVPRTLPTSVAFSPTGRLLATGNGGSTSLFAVAADGNLTQVPGSPFFDRGISGIAFSPGGGLLAGVSTGSTVSVYEVVGDPSLSPVPGSPFSTLGAGNSGVSPSKVAFSPVGGLLASANHSVNNDDVSVFAPTGGLEIGKVASVGVAHPGGLVQYTVRVHNPQQDEAVGAVSDDLSGVLDQAAYQGDASATSGSVAFNSSGETLTWDGRLAAGATATITYSVRVNTGLLGGLLSNGLTGPPGSTCAGRDPLPPCTTATPIEPAPGPGPDLVLTKSASAQSVHPGGQVSYTLVVHNRGKGEARGVTLVDPGPSGVFFQQVRASQGGCSIGGGGLRCGLGSIPAGGSVVVMVTATVRRDASGTIVNLATVEDAQHDSRPPNNTASASVRVVPLPRPPTVGPGPQPVSDLSIAKRASRTRVAVGGRLSYTLTVTNNGPQPAGDVRVSDAARLPMRIQSVRASQGSCQTGKPIRCQLGNLAGHAHATIRITAVPTVTGSQVNAATVTTGSWDTTSATLALARTHIHGQHRRPPPPFTG
jgi:uncharacterized repeat protein (TIGR01451 family)